MGGFAIRTVNGLLLMFILFVPFERLFALRPGKVFRKQFWSDVSFYVMNSVIVTFLLAIPFGILAWGISRLPLHGVQEVVIAWPFWLKLVVGLVAGEAGGYWAHRLMHQIPLLWRFHVIHHAAEEMDWLVNIRVHPVEVVFMRMFQFVPLFALGLLRMNHQETGWLMVLIPLIGATWGHFIHSNTRLRFGALEWLVTTPAFHHWHHTNDAPKLHNKNYSSRN